MNEPFNPLYGLLYAIFTLVFWLVGQGVLRKWRKDKRKLEEDSLMVTSLNLKSENKYDEFDFTEGTKESKEEIMDADDGIDNFKRNKEGYFSWMSILWNHSQSDVINSVGLDSAIYLQFLKYCALYFLISSCVCSFLLE